MPSLPRAVQATQSSANALWKASEAQVAPEIGGEENGWNMLIQPNILQARGDMVIRHTAPNDLPYLKKLTKQESFALGWIPEQMFDRVWREPGRPIFTGWVIICEVNQDPVGFCFAAPSARAGRHGRLYQLAVQADARRYEYGTFITDAICDLALAAGTQAMTLRCACDLPANSFWETLGWKVTDIVHPGSPVGDSPRTVRRPLYRRVKELTLSLGI